MKKRLMFILLAICVCGIVKGQEKVNEAQEQRLPGYKTSFEANPFWHNWFISANFGANALFAEGSTDAKFKNTLTFMPVLAVGKWFNPWWGVRLQGGGGSLHGFQNNAENMIHMHYAYAHADFMLGLINFFAKYKENRRFDLVPYLGIGGMTRKKDQSFTINAGLQARYAISERFDVNIELQGMILDDDLVVKGGFPNDGIGGLTAGITYRFKNRKFRQAVKREVADKIFEDNTYLKRRVEQLESRAPEVKIVEREVIKEQEAPLEVYSQMSFVIPFYFNSYQLQTIHRPILWNVSKFMEAHPDLKIVITGYADKFGTDEVNQRISKERANTVATILQKEYGISPERMFIKYEGKENPFYKDNNKWNRCVIIEVAK